MDMWWKKLNKNQYSINECLDILEMDYSTFDIIPNQTPYNEAVQKLEVFKQKVKKQRKILAKKYHPDVKNGSNEKMQLINRIVDSVMVLQIQIPRPRRVVFEFSFHGYGTTATTASTF